MSDKPFYSQYQEDFYVWSIIREQSLTDIPRRCVEIGACDGKHLSNTRAFAEDGWEAWFVEPCPQWQAALLENCAALPQAHLVQAAIGDVDGEIELVVDASVPDHSFVANVERPVHARDDKPLARVPCLTYATLATRIAGAVGLLSVDTEGFDTSIIRQLVRPSPALSLPWFVIVESIIQSDRREQMESLLPHYHLINVVDLNTIWLRRDIAARWIKP